MWINTLLKVLEQLLHKIKANRRREIPNLSARGCARTLWDTIAFYSSLLYIEKPCGNEIHNMKTENNHHYQNLSNYVSRTHYAVLLQVARSYEFNNLPADKDRIERFAL